MKIVYTLKAEKGFEITVFDLATRKKEKIIETGRLSMVGFVGGDDLVAAIGARSLNQGAQVWSLKRKKLVAEWRDGGFVSHLQPSAWNADRLFRSILELMSDSWLADKSRLDVYLPPASRGQRVRIAAGGGHGITIFDGRSWAKVQQQKLGGSMRYFAGLARLPLSKEIKNPAYSPDGRFIAIANRHEPVTLWRAFPSVRELVEHARQVATVCLSRRHRLRELLPEQPPAWCIKYKKKPYDTAAWQAWQAGGRKGPMPKRN